MDQYTYGAELLKKYEGFTSRATWDVNAYRLGYGSDTLTFENNTYRKVKQGDTTTKANATKDLERRLKEFEKKVIKKIGAQYWEPLNYQVKAALLSLAYNYGNITKKSIIEAIKTQDNKQIADALIKSTYNDNPGKYQAGLRKRRSQEAAIIEKAPQPKKPGSGIIKLLLLLPLLYVGYTFFKK